MTVAPLSAPPSNSFLVITEGSACSIWNADTSFNEFPICATLALDIAIAVFDDDSREDTLVKPAFADIIDRREKSETSRTGEEGEGAEANREDIERVKKLSREGLDWG